MIRRIVVTVTRTVPLVGSASSYHLHLSAAGVVEVRRLPESIDLEFFDGFDWRSYDARSHAVGLAAGETGEVLDVADGIARHIIRVVPTIDGESVLVHIAAGDIASRRHAGLQAQKRGCVTAEVRQQLKILQVNRVANRCIRGLKF